MTDLPGVCQECRERVRYTRGHWRDSDGEPHVCGLSTYSLGVWPTQVESVNRVPDNGGVSQPTIEDPTVSLPEAAA